MKKYLILFLLLTISSCAISYPVYQGKTVLDEVVTTDKKKDNAFDDSLAFFAKYMNDSNSSVKMKDKDSGRLIAKISHPCTFENAFGQKDESNLNYVAEVQFKDKRAKLKLELGTTLYSTISNSFVPIPDSVRSTVEACFESLFSNLKSELGKKSDSNW